MEQVSLRQVAGLHVVAQNTGDLRKSPVISCSVLHHVARDKANAAAIDPIGYPNFCDCHLLFPRNHQLQFAKHTTTSSFNTRLQISCSLHKQPWQLTVIPTILTRIPHGWMGSSNHKGTDAAAGTEGRTVVGFFSAGGRTAALLTPTRERARAQQWAQALQRAEESSSGACRGAL